MGYRSDVAIAFYPADAESKGVVTLWLKENLPFDTWNVDEYWLIDEAQGSYIFRAEDVKWYADNQDVDLIETVHAKFIDLFCTDNLVGGCEYVRIGEELEDVTEQYNGNCRYKLSVTRSIHIS